MKAKRAGFTLVEMAIVLVIVGLLLGGLLMPLSAQVEQRRIGETQKALDEIKEALVGFAIANTIFISKTPAATFDDLVAWVSPNILFNRMVTAGKLP